MLPKPALFNYIPEIVSQIEIDYFFYILFLTKFSAFRIFYINFVICGIYLASSQLEILIAFSLQILMQLL